MRSWGKVHILISFIKCYLFYKYTVFLYDFILWILNWNHMWLPYCFTLILSHWFTINVYKFHFLTQICQTNICPPSLQSPLSHVCISTAVTKTVVISQDTYSSDICWIFIISFLFIEMNTSYETPHMMYIVAFNCFKERCEICRVSDTVRGIEKDARCQKVWTYMTITAFKHRQSALEDSDRRKGMFS